MKRWPWLALNLAFLLGAATLLFVFNRAACTRQNGTVLFFLTLVYTEVSARKLSVRLTPHGVHYSSWYGPRSLGWRDVKKVASVPWGFELRSSFWNYLGPTLSRPFLIRNVAEIAEAIEMWAPNNPRFARIRSSFGKLRSTT